MAEENTREIEYVLADDSTVGGRTAVLMHQAQAKKAQLDLGLSVGKAIDDKVHIPKNRLTAEQQLYALELVETWCGNVWQPADFDPEKVVEGWIELGCCVYCLSLRFQKSPVSFSSPLTTQARSRLQEGTWQLRWYNSETGQVL